MSMFVLLLLQIKHFLIDWAFQTEYQIENKGKYLHIGGIIHSLQHAIATALVIFIVDPSHALLLGLVDGIIHYHIDWSKQNLSAMWKLTTSDKRFWILIGADQLAHQLTYLAIVYFI